MRMLYVGVILLATVGTGALAGTVTMDKATASAAGAAATSADQQIGLGSWQGTGTDKAVLYLVPEDMFGREVAVQELASISYYTKKSGAQTDPDWGLLIYTKPFTGGDASWYGRRLNAEPLYSSDLNAPAGQWNRWFTAAGDNQLRFYDSNRTVAGFYNGPALADLQAGPLDWGAYPTSGSSDVVDYSSEPIKYLSLQTGSSWAVGFTGKVDAVEIALSDGSSVLVDLENAPQVWVDDDFDSSTWGWQLTHFANIQAAIDAVDVGGTVNVAAGTYAGSTHLGSWIWKDLNIQKSLNLVGAGSGEAIVHLSEGKTNGVEIRGSGMSVTLEGLTFTRDPANSYGPGFALRIAETASTFDNLIMRDVEVAYAAGRNVFMGNSVYQNVVVEDCNVHHSGAWGFSARGTINNMTIENSRFEYNGLADPGHGIGFDIDTPISASNLNVVGGSFSFNKSKGINLVKTSNATFSGITASNNGGAPGGGFGVSLWEWHSASSGLTFSGCTFSNNATDGILFGTEGTTSIDDVAVDCCTITGNKRSGILFYHNFGGTATNVVVSNSSIVGNGDGIATSALAATVTAEQNWWGHASGPSGVGTGLGDRVGANVDFDPWLTTVPACQQNVLYLQPETPSLFVKPGEPVIVDMNIANLAQMVNGCQALLGYSSTYFPTAGTVVPGGGPWTELIYESWSVPGEIDTAIGVTLDGGPAGTDEDNTIAILALQAGTTEGKTRVVFRPDGGEGYATMLSDLNAEPVWPLKIDSTTIVIDGTAPVDVTIAADPAGWSNSNSVTLTFSANDPLAGVDYYQLAVDGGAFFTASSPYSLDTSALVDGAHAVTVKAVDRAGNEATANTTIHVDRTAPVVSIDSATQAGEELIGTSVKAVQGTVDIYVNASDATAGLAGNPTVTVTPNGGTAQAATFVDETAGVFHYTWTVTATTANGAATIDASVTDSAGNSSTAAPQTFNINKNQVSGQIELQYFLGTGTTPAHTVRVTFVASGGIYARTWTVELTNSGGAVFDYALTDVPAGTVYVSAKTDWHLRRGLATALDGDGQALLDFAGSGGILLGGDLNGDNIVNILDYSILKNSWNSYATDADINGDGQVQVFDYALLKGNWFRRGDPQ